VTSTVIWQPKPPPSDVLLNEEGFVDPDLRNSWTVSPCEGYLAKYVQTVSGHAPWGFVVVRTPREDGLVVGWCTDFAKLKPTALRTLKWTIPFDVDEGELELAAGVFTWKPKVVATRRLERQANIRKNNARRAEAWRALIGLYTTVVYAHNYPVAAALLEG